MIAAALANSHLVQVAEIESGQAGHNALDLAGLETLASRDAFRGFGLFATGDGQDVACELVSHAVFVNAGKSADLVSIATREGRKRLGHAGALLGHALAALWREGVEEVFLEVAVDNAAARALYRKAGFVEMARRSGYYARPEGGMDAVVMRVAHGGTEA